ncbi:MAG: hypothetical protein HY043_17285 [Verrucomicrobia bacterium]|nr:hypothetical protein [Verrucomicrobiota bacterium]
MTMSQAAHLAIIADHVQPRAQALAQLLASRYRIRVVLVKTWKELLEKSKAAKTGQLRLLVLADGFPGEGSLQQRVRSLLLTEALEADVVAISENDQVPFAKLKRAHLLVAKAETLTEAKAIRCFAECRHLPEQRLLPVIRFATQDDLILKHQLRSLDHTEDYETGIRLLQELIHKLLRGVREATIVRLSQGYSGSLVFRLDWKDAEEEKIYVLKISRQADAWKVENGARYWPEIEKALTKGGLNRHAPQRISPPKDNRMLPGVVRAGGLYAEAWAFLGEKLGRIIDFEEAYRFGGQWPNGTPERSKVIAGSAMPAQFVALETLSLLRKAWYDTAKTANRSALWDNGDAPYPGIVSFPPYRLTQWWKVQILSSLERLKRLGERLLSGEWKHGTDVIAQWLREGFAPQNRKTPRLRVAISPIHGDLNKNNVLFWLEEMQPLLIDFATYQPEGHALQDFANLESQIKFGLMDTEHESSATAYDLSPERLATWLRLEEKLAAIGNFRKPPVPARFLKGQESIKRAFHIVTDIRSQAFAVHCKAFKKRNYRAFIQEYSTALLFHSLKTIGYENLSPFKRLLAVASSTRLIEFLSK